jgi:hypothetical protein
MGLAAAIVAVGVAAQPAPTAQASAGPPATVPAQLPGYPWGGVAGWPGGFVYFGPDFTSPYAGNPGYPYYRYGASYGSAFGPPYPVAPTYSPYYGGSYGAGYPAYSSAGGVSLGDAGYSVPFGRCLYSSTAGIGGSWSDPLSYGYLAPFC